MKDGFVKIALAAPKIRVADPEYNAGECVRIAKAAAESGAKLLAFPELVLTGATCGDLFFSEALLSATEEALAQYAHETAECDLISFIGFPLRSGSNLFDAVAEVAGGDIINIHVCNEPCPSLGRQFSSGSLFADGGFGFVQIGDISARVENGICKAYVSDIESHLRIFVEVGADSKSLDPMASRAALAGATLIINPFAEPHYLGEDKARRIDTAAASRRYSAVYACVGATLGESGTDGIYTSERIVASLGEIVSECEPFGEEIFYTTVDVGACDAVRLADPRFRKGTIGDFIETDFYFKNADSPTPVVKRSPFVPECKCERDKTCALSIEMQARALAERMERAYAKCAVLGVSGGLDSTLAILVAARAADILGRSRESVIAITMPCFGTSKRTKDNALSLARELGCTLRTIDIKAAVERHFKDIAHDKDNYNVVYENAQARERTQILMDVANAEGGIVVGTGDLSELALGFATYNGDHMSMYGVNASVPKTLMRAIVTYAAEAAANEGKTKLAKVLYDVVNTPVSPELLPISGAENAQHTENIVGPYELHDFFLYYTVKFGFSKRKILRLAKAAFLSDYTEEDISRYLDIFTRRFISQQFKRSCLPDGPRVSEISLSPRGGWAMPSDASGAAFKK